MSLNNVLLIEIVFRLRTLQTVLLTSNQKLTASGQGPPPGPVRAPCVSQTGLGLPAPAGSVTLWHLNIIMQHTEARGWLGVISCHLTRSKWTHSL